MKLTAFALASVAALALGACSQEQQALEGDMLTVDETEDALATDTAVLPSQDTSGQAPPVASDPASGPTTTAPPVDSIPESDPDNRT